MVGQIMNKNKLSSFLIHTSLGMIAALCIGDVSAFISEESEATERIYAQQAADIARHRADAIRHLNTKIPTISGVRVLNIPQSTRS
jgi:hypothetical protein